MSSDRLSDILDAAYICFTRHGLRRTTMDDIAQQVGLSRATVYLSVRNKEDAYRQVAARLMAEAQAAARTAVAGCDDPTERLLGVLEAKLGLAVALHRDSVHATELLAEDSRLLSDLTRAYVDDLRGLLMDTLVRQMPDGEAQELADILLALAYGLEPNITDAAVALSRLRRAVTLIVAGFNRSAPGEDGAPVERNGP